MPVGEGASRRLMTLQDLILEKLVRDAARGEPGLTFSVALST